MKPSKIILLSLLIITVFSCGPNSKGEPVKKVIETRQLEKSWDFIVTTDEFGDETGSKEIVGNFKGTFSNSATSNSSFDVTVKVVDSSFYTLFSEYGNNLASLPENQSINIKVKTEEGDIIKVRQFLFKNMMCDVDEDITLFKLLQEHEKMKVLVDFSILENYHGNTKYVYELKRDNLKELL